MTAPQPTSLMSDSLYNCLKQTATIVLPALGALYFGLAQIWGLPKVDEIVGTIAVLNLAAGGTTAVAKKLHTVSGARYAGTLIVEELEEGTSLRMTNLSAADVDTKDELVFNVVRK